MKSRFVHSLQGFGNSIFACVMIICLCGQVSARDLKASLGYLPQILESPDKGAFVDLVKALDDVYTEGNIKIKVYPMARSIKNVVKGKADFHIPLIRNTVVPKDSLPYRFSTESFGKVVFVIYSNKKAFITAQMLKEARDKVPFPFKIETCRGLEEYFDFPVISSNTIDQSLKKVSVRRVDGFVWAQEEADYTLQTLDLKVIHRELYCTFDDIAVIPKGPNGDEIDAILSRTIISLRDSGRLQELYHNIHLPYSDWQPDSAK